MSNASISGAAPVASADFLELRGGPSGVRVMKNDGTAVNFTLSDAGAMAVPGGITAPLTGSATSVPASGLTGTTMAANVVASSLTSVGTLASVAVSGAATAGTVAVGGGTIITNIQSLPTALTPAAVAANTTAEQTFAVAGLAVNDKVFVNKPTAQAGLGIVGFRVAGAGSLGLTFSNNTAAAITPTAAETYQIVAIRS